VIVTAKETGLYDQLQIVRVVVSPTKPDLELARVNPLMKIPTLVTKDGLPLFESSIICQYLDSLHAGPKLVPDADKWRILRTEAIADGILDAGVLVRYEGLIRSKEQWNQAWVDGQTQKVLNGLDLLEQDFGWAAGGMDLGKISVACSLRWLLFRQPVAESLIRPHRSRLFQWFDEFEKRPSLAETMPTA
jgi:glutathione S-transferase